MTLTKEQIYMIINSGFNFLTERKEAEKELKALKAQLVVRQTLFQGLDIEVKSGYKKIREELSGFPQSTEDKEEIVKIIGRDIVAKMPARIKQIEELEEKIAKLESRYFSKDVPHKDYEK